MLQDQIIYSFTAYICMYCLCIIIRIYLKERLQIKCVNKIYVLDRNKVKKERYLIRQYNILCFDKLPFSTIGQDESNLQKQRERWRNVLFNDALNTFYLRLYGVRHMVKDHSDSEKGNPLPPHRLLLSINSKGSFICTIPQTG